LRSVLAPLRPQNPACGPTGVSAPVLAGGYVYAITNYKLSKYNAATGRLIWRINPDPTLVTHCDSLAVSGNLVIVGGDDSCMTESEISGSIFCLQRLYGRTGLVSEHPA
jgi:outer membrane protein assembly factor BamB